MKKIITALANPILNNELKKQKDFIVIGNDIQYQDGVKEVLEKEKNIDFLILSEILPGENKIEKLIEDIKEMNPNINIIIILENKKEELEKYLYSKSIYYILYNKTEITEIINVIKNKKEDESEKIKQELNELKQIIINQNNKEINNKRNKIIRKIKGKKNNKINNLKKEIICILGSSGVGKSIFAVNLAKSLIYSKQKILIIDFDILNNSLHAILGVKKYSEKISKKIKENNLIKEKINLKELIIKINKKIDLISGINLLFDSKYKISNFKINNIIQNLKQYYDVIIIDTSSACFLDYTKEIIKISNINIFILEPNILEIKKSKKLLDIYTNEWEINKNKINILFNKFNKNSIDINLLKYIFGDYNILGKININEKYNLIINNNAKKINKEIKKEYINIIKKILIIKNKKNYIKIIKNKILERTRKEDE